MLWVELYLILQTMLSLNRQFGQMGQKTPSVVDFSANALFTNGYGLEPPIGFKLPRPSGSGCQQQGQA